MDMFQLDEYDKKNLTKKFNEFGENFELMKKELNKENACTILNTNIEKKWKTEMFKTKAKVKLYFKLYCNDLDQLYKSINFIKYDFICDELKKHVDEQKRHIDYLKSQYSSLDLNKNSLFDNTDENKWVITYDNEKIKFDRPKWFDHTDLLNWLPTTIINIEYLSKLFDFN